MVLSKVRPQWRLSFVNTSHNWYLSKFLLLFCCLSLLLQVQAQDCPEVAVVNGPEAGICQGATFTVEALGLVNFTRNENGTINYDLQLVYLPVNHTEDPYEAGVVLATTTPQNGQAVFSNVVHEIPPGEYAFYTLPFPAPADPNCRPTPGFELSVGPCESLGDFVFIDFGDDGNFNGPDIPLSGVTVEILNAINDATIYEMGPLVTNNLGQYTFGNVPEGEYFLLFSNAIPNWGLEPATGLGIGPNNTNNFAPDLINGVGATPDFVFSAEMADTTKDVAYRGVGSIRGNVWADDNFNELFSPNEEVENVELSLRWAGFDNQFATADDVLLSDMSEVDGTFEFLHLPYGQYQLELGSTVFSRVAAGYDLWQPINLPYLLSLSVDNVTEGDQDFAFVPQCLPSTGMLSTFDPLVMCGNDELGIYPNQPVRVRIQQFTTPASIPEDYAYWLVVVNPAGEIVQSDLVANPGASPTIVVDLTGLPTGDYGIHAVHYLLTDPDLLTPFNFNVGNSFNTITNLLSHQDGQTVGGPICGDVSLTVDNLVVAMEPQPPVFLACIGSVNAALNNECAINVTPQMVLSGDYGCLIPADFNVEIYVDDDLVSEEGLIMGCGQYEYRIDVRIPNTPGFPCWGYINAFDNRAPSLTCPADVSGGINREGEAFNFFCSDLDELFLGGPLRYVVAGDGSIVSIDSALAAVLDITGYPTVTDGCDFVEVTIVDQYFSNGDCGVAYIEREFRAADKYNSTCTGLPNEAIVCRQRINLRKPTIDEVILPPAVVELPCADFSGATNPTPEEIAIALDTFGYPSVFSFFDADASLPGFQANPLNQVYCNVGASYQDLPRINICGSSFSFIREWFVIDDCDAGSVRTLRQLIKIKDNTDPTLELPTVDYNFDGLPDVRRFSTSPAGCLAFIRFPNPISLTDFCAGPPSLTIKVRDEENTLLYTGSIEELVSLPLGLYTVEYCATDGCDNQSCAIMPFIVRDKIEPSMICDDALNVQIGGGDINVGLLGIARIQATAIDEGSSDNCGGPLALEVRRNLWEEGDCSFDSDAYSPWQPYVDFYCCDLGRSVEVELRATDEAGNSAYCWLTIAPEDNLRPFCTAPPAATLTCAEWPTVFPGDIEQAYADDFVATSTMMMSLFGAPGGTDNCALDTLVELQASINLNSCGWGSITRRFAAWQWLGDANDNNQIDAEEVLSSGNTCTQLITLTETHAYTLDFPEDASADCLDPTPADLVWTAEGCENIVVNRAEPARFTSTGDECYKLSYTYDVINWCIWDGAANPYVIGREVDLDDTTVDRCERPVVIVDDNVAIIDRRHPEPGCSSNLTNAFIIPTEENVGRWQYTQFVKVYDNSAPTFAVNTFGGPTDLCPTLQVGEFGSLDNLTCSAEVVIEFSLEDACEEFNDRGDFVLSVEEILLAWNVPDTNEDGEINAIEFASTPSDDAEEYLTYSATNNEFTFSYATTPLSGLPDTYHTIYIGVVDGCGNRNAIYLPFKVIDCKAPGLSCLASTISVISPSAEGECTASLWASDLLASPGSDCSEPLGYAIYRSADIDAPDFVPNPIDTGIVFTLPDEGVVPVTVFAFDTNRNTSTCQVEVTVQPSEVCAAIGFIGGMIMTEEEVPVPGAMINLSGPEPLMTTTGQDGMYAFDRLEEGFDYTVSAFLDDEHDNGVTTFDLVLISKHILTTQLLDSPYKLIAADVNRSGSITTLDMIQMRKVILRINETFPNNTSWRFIDADYAFPRPDNPWSTFFPELININDLLGEVLDAGFIAVKVGDVNGSAVFE